MNAFAKVSDLESRWRILSVEEKARAETLLLDATVKITLAMNDYRIAIDATNEAQTMALTAINCEMVKRAMLSPVDAPPLSQFSQTAGPYTESQTYVNPTGDLYMTSAEKKTLGIGGQRIGSISPLIGGE